MDETPKISKLHSIKFELTLWFLLLSILPLAIVSGFSYQQAKQGLADVARKQLEQSAQSSAYFIQNWVDYRVMDLNSLVAVDKNLYLIQSFRDELQSSSVLSQDYVKSDEWQRLLVAEGRHLLDFKAHYDYVDNVVLLDTKGNVLFSASEDLQGASNLVDGRYSSTPIATKIQYTMKSKESSFLGFGLPFSRNNMNAGLLMAPLIEESGRVAGVFLVQINLDRIYKFINKDDDSVRHYLVSENGDLKVLLKQNESSGAEQTYWSTMVSTFLNEGDRRIHENTRVNNAKSYKPERDEFAREHSSGERNVGTFSVSTYKNHVGAEVFGTYNTINFKGVEWYLVSEINVGDALSSASLLGKVVFWMVIAVIALVVLISVEIARRITRPISELVDATYEFSIGNLDPKITIDKKNEIGLLAEVFNKMLLKRRLYEHSLNASHRKIEKTLAELADQKYALDQHSIVAVTDIKGTITYANERFCKVSGYSSQELIGSNHRILKSGVHAKEFFHQMYLTITRGKVWHGEVCNKSKNGDLYWVDTTIVPFMVEGKPKSYVAIRTEITEKVLSGLALKASEERYDLAMSVANDGVWDWDLTTDKVIFDDRYYTMAGYQVDEFPHEFSEWKRRVHPDDIEYTIQVVQDYIEGRRDDYEVEFRFMRKDKGYIWMLARGKIVAYDATGKPSRMVGTHNDITTRKKAADELKKSEEHLALLVNTVPYGIQENDINGVITFSNIAHHNIMEKEPGDLIGQHIWDSQLKQSEKDKLKEYFFYLVESQPDPEPYITQDYTKNGREILLEVVWDYRRDEEGKLIGFICVISDITARSKSEKALQNAQKMESIGQVTGGIAHDFNNILGIVVGNLDLLNAQLRKNPKAHDRVVAASKAADRAAKLTKQLLGFSRRKVAESTLTNINRLVEDMNEILRHSTGHKINVEYNLEDCLWLTELDVGDFHDALLNMTINARDAMNAEGSVLIETLNCEVDEGYCSLNPGMKPGEYVQLAISDSGEGIPKEKQQQIFEPFFTTKSQGKGTGLGLSMVFGFVKRSGGCIQVYSEEGIGTTFRLYLPRCNRVESDKEILESSRFRLEEKPKPYGNETILIVDDEEALLDLAKHTLEELGYEVVVANSGSEALEKLSQWEKIDLVFSDIVMPGGMSGFELAQRVEQHYPRIKILLTSGYTGKAVKNTGMTEYTGTLLNKPYTQLEMAFKIREMLGDSKFNGDADSYGVVATNVSGGARIEWSHKYSIGIDVIDDDHRRLLLLLDECKEKERKSDSESLKSLLVEMLSFAKEHFRREEIVMEICGYPHYKNHKQVHQLLLKQIKIWQRNLEEGAVELVEMLTFLEQWLIEHIGGMDAEIAPFCEGKHDEISAYFDSMEKPLDVRGDT